MVNDGVNSLTRLYKNHFKDSSKQVAIDYILGLHEADVFVKRYTTPASVLDLGSLNVFKDDAGEASLAPPFLFPLPTSILSFPSPKMPRCHSPSS